MAQPTRRRLRLERPKVGIVLGAGGVLGGAWMVGALNALEQVSGWDPRTADHLVGTSAGAVFAALLACGVAPSELLPARGGPGGWLLAELASESTYRRARLLPGAPIGSWRLALAALAQRPSRRSLLHLVSGVVPTGDVRPEPIARTIRHVVERGWAPHSSCRIVATDYATGRRVVFGDGHGPEADIAEAVAASCAIPGLFQPVKINGRRYVDGGLGSLCNLDLLAGQDLDLVICFNAMTSRATDSGATLLNRAVHYLLQAAAEDVRRQARRLSARGVEVILVEPTARDRAAMGTDLMQARNWAAVLRTALSGVRGQLRRRESILRLGAIGTAA